MRSTTESIHTFVLSVALSIAATPVLATSYVMVSDADLVAQAPTVVTGRIVDVAPAATDGTPKTEYTLEVDRVLKGHTMPGTIAVRVLGGEADDGSRLEIRGAPVFQRDEDVLLFLDREPDGAYAPLHLMLGAFHEVELRGHRLALRDLSGAHEVQRGVPGEATVRSEVRDFDRFGEWIAAQARGDARAPDYFVVDPDRELVDINERFTLTTDPSGRPFRWPTFDSGGNVVWQRQAGGDFGIANADARIRAGMRAWNDERGTPIDYRLSGTTNNTNGFQQPDNVNAIIAEDPNGEIAGRVVCGQGGVLAIGGFWAQGTHTWKGDTYWTNTNGDLVTNDGFAACFAAGNPSGVAEVFGHELGHSLGLGHSCGDTATPLCSTSTKLADALMTALVKNDGRGARLGADDIEGIRLLYAPALAADTSPCRSDATTLCVGKNDRFEVTMGWTAGNALTLGERAGALQPAEAVDYARDSSFFHFGNANNLEVLLKVLDACKLNTRLWVFAAAATSVEFEITVRDTESGAVKSYFNPPGHAADTVNDTDAFATCE